MSKKMIDTFTRFSNDLLDNLMKSNFNGSEMRIILAVVRMTFGYHKEDAKLSLSYISKMVGRNKPVVSKTLNSLIEKKVIIVVEKETTHGSRILKINPDYYLELSSTKSIIKTDGGSSSPLDTSIDQLETGELPNWLLGVDQLETKELTILTPIKEISKEMKIKEIRNKEKISTSSPDGEGPDPIGDIYKIWLEEYLKAYGYEYETENIGKDRSGIGKLLALIKRKHKIEERRYPSKKELLDIIRDIYSRCVQIENNFYRSYLSPMLIYSNFNAIKSILIGENKPYPIITKRDRIRAKQKEISTSSTESEINDLIRIAIGNK